MTVPEFKTGDKVRKAYGGSTVYTVANVETIFDWKTSKRVPRVNIKSASGKLYARDPHTLVKVTSEDNGSGQKEGNMAKITLELDSSDNLRRDVKRLAASWSRTRLDCNGREFEIELGDFVDVETGDATLDAALTVQVRDCIDERMLTAGQYIYVIDESTFDASTTPEEFEAFCRRFEAKCTVLEGDDVSIGARRPHGGEAPGLYELRAGRLQILGGAISIPEEIEHITDVAYEYAMETWADNSKDTFTVLVKFEIKATSQEEANQAVIGALGLLDNDEDGLTPSQYSVIEENKSPSECTEQRKGKS